LGIAAVTTTATLVVNLAAALGASRHAAFAAGIAFAVGSVCNGGLATNAELLMVVFTTAALLAAVRQKPFQAGICFAIAVFIKPVALFELLALLYGLFLTRPVSFRPLAWIAAGSLIVPILAIAYLAASGGLAGFWQDAVLDNFIRVSGQFDWFALKRAGIGQVCWLGLYALLVVLHARVIWLWLLGGVVGVVAGKYFYLHYFIQILPALCVAFALGVDRLFARRRTAIVCSLGLLAPTAAIAVFIISFLLRSSHDERSIAATIPSGASLYVFNGQPVLYLLAGSRPPTPYVLPTVLTGNRFHAVAQIDPLQEIDKIFHSKPQFVVTGAQPLSAPPGPGSDSNPVAFQTAQDWLEGQYVVYKVFPDAVVYQHR